MSSPTGWWIEAATRHVLEAQWPDAANEPNIAMVFATHIDPRGYLISTGEAATLDLALGIYNGGGQLPFGRAWHAVDERIKRAFIEALAMMYPPTSEGRDTEELAGDNRSTQ